MPGLADLRLFGYNISVHREARPAETKGAAEYALAADADEGAGNPVCSDRAPGVP